MTAISGAVWRKGWRRDAIATQEASAEVAAFIHWLEQRRFDDSAKIIRKVAMHYGVRETRADLHSAISVTRRQRRQSP